MRDVWAAAFLLRRLRAERGVVLLLVLLVGLTSFIWAAAPRLYNREADAALRSAVSDTTTARGNIELVQELAVPGGTDPAEFIDRLGATYEGRFGGAVSGLIGSRERVATTPRFRLNAGSGFQTFVALRDQTGVTGKLTLRDGRWPASTGERLPPLGEGSDPTQGLGEIPHVEIAISDQTAQELGLKVGMELRGVLDANDPLLTSNPRSSFEALFDIAGIFSMDDLQAPVWYADNSLGRPGADFDKEPPIAFATALVAPEALADLVTSGLPFRYAWHYFVDPDRMDAGQLEALIPELKRLESSFASSPLSAPDPNRVVLRTGLLPIVQAHVAQVAASQAVLSVAALGPLGLAVAAVAMLAILLIARRRRNLVLARGRGASTSLMLGAQVWEATLLAGAAALVGYALAVVLVPARPSGLSPALAIGTAFAAVLVLAAAAARPAVRRPIEASARDGSVSVRRSPRRLVLEVTAIGLALAGIGLLQQRGITSATGERGVTRFDPLLAAVPVLTAFAAGLVAIRLYPIPIRGLGWLAARRRDLVPVLGLRSVGRSPSLNTLPLLVLMLTAAFGSFALVVTASIDRGQLEASWHEVGADYRIDAPLGSSITDLGVVDIPGVEAVATAFVNPTTRFQVSTAIGRVPFEAIDAAELATVTAGAPIAVSWPAEFTPPAGVKLGTVENPLPVIGSQAMTSGVDALAPGRTAHLRVGDITMSVRVVEVRSIVPGHAVGDRFIVTSVAALQAAAPGQFKRNTMFVRGPASIAGDLEALVASKAPAETTVASRHAWYAGLRGAPLNAVVGNGFRIGLLVAVVYAVFAVVTALTLTASRRTQDLAFLRTLGVSRAQAAGVTAVEHGIPVAVAVGPGVATGIAVAVLLQKSLGLDAFIGAGTTYRIEVDWPGIVGMAILLLIVVAVAVAVSTWLSRRASVVEALRVGET